jgi:4'-phosphopantetheinyl transferase
MTGSAFRAWLRFPMPLTIPLDWIDIWRVRLDSSCEEYFAADILSCDEIARRSGFYFEEDRNYFTRCRVALRVLLAAYLAVPASEIEFQYEVGGKPQVAHRQNPHALEFNVSHSGGLGLIGFCSQRRLGVDVERIHQDNWASVLAERFFSSHERRVLRALADHRRTHGFFACWTRKEAFLKATGLGLSFPLSDFSVTADPDHAPRLEEISGNTEVAEHWSLADIGLGDGWRAAVAIEGPRLFLRTYDWN